MVTLLALLLGASMVLAQSGPAVRPSAAPPQRIKATAQRTPTTKASPKRPSPTKSAVTKATAPKASRTKPAPGRKRPIRPARTASGRAVPSQARPTPERYREIQSALIERGFLSGEASGVWDDSSVNALKQFERSQKLSADGKIDALALIALGLGPRRDAPSANPGPSPSAGPAQEQK